VSATATATNLTVTANINVSTPNWVGYKDASASEQKSWDSFIAGLKNHEEGHVGIDIAAAGEMQSTMKGIIGRGNGNSEGQAISRATANLGTNLKSVFNAVQFREQVVSQAYDIYTNYGRNQ
jgi:predicted secreted Zn-dependent protease